MMIIIVVLENSLSTSNAHLDHRVLELSRWVSLLLHLWQSMHYHDEHPQHGSLAMACHNVVDELAHADCFQDEESLRHRALKA